MKGTEVASVDAQMRVVSGTTPPAAEVDVDLDGQTFTLPTTVARVLLERLATSVTSAERYGRGEEYRRALQLQQAGRVTDLRTQAASHAAVATFGVALVLVLIVGCEVS